MVSTLVGPTALAAALLLLAAAPRAQTDVTPPQAGGPSPRGSIQRLGVPALAPDIAAPRLQLPRVGLAAGDLAVVINEADAASVELGAYYAQRRGIPRSNVIQVRFPAGRTTLSRDEFHALAASLSAQVPPGVQAYALAWTLPYRVDCMSITSAIALGFDPAWCADGCRPTKPSPYFDSSSRAPHDDHAMRPAMLLAGRDLASAKALVDRGVRSDHLWSDGSAYLLSTGDAKRNVRAVTYPDVQRRLLPAYPIRRVDADAIENQPDVMFHFSGVQRVRGMASNRFPPGAFADHLTSLGGYLEGAGQTTALDWLQAGATGSYGTTSEPCNFLGKFPDIGVLMRRYLGGETLIEASWKSLRMPGQGVLVGEPLARPFAGVRARRVGDGLVVQTRSLRPGRYAVQTARSGIGPFRTVGELAVTSAGVTELRLLGDAGTWHRVSPLPLASAR